MTPRPRALPGAALLLAFALAGAGCARPAPESHASAVERAACKQHAEDVYKMRNKTSRSRIDDLYIKIRLNRDCITITVHSFHTELYR